ARTGNYLHLEASLRSLAHPLAAMSLFLPRKIQKPGLYQVSDEGARRDCPTVFEQAAPHFHGLRVSRRLMLHCLENSSGVGPAPSPVIFTRSADVSVRGDLMDGLDSPSSIAGVWLAA
ncbi:MAG: hypothetical protein R6V12_06250, partial [Candidatus Hydrogenedentota bacterium]